MDATQRARQRGQSQLTRRWGSWFVALVGVIGLTCAATLLGIDQFAGGLGHAGSDAAVRSRTVGDVERAGFDYERAANALVTDDTPANAAAFTAAGAALHAEFAQASLLFRDDSPARKDIDEAQATWAAYQKAVLSTVATAGSDHGVPAGLSAIADNADAEGAALMSDAYRLSVDEVGRARALEHRLLGGLALAFSVSLTAAAWLARKAAHQVLRPVEHLREGAARLAAGDLRHRVVVQRHDELGDLAHSFNAMADALAEHHDELSFQATHDSLTGLANRAEFHDVLNGALRTGGRWATTVLFVDLDDFKVVNDTDGHGAGDAVLQCVAERLRDCCRGTDFVARLGGDEFAVIVQHPVGGSEPAAMASRILEAFGSPFEVGGVEYTMAASVGVATAGPEGSEGGAVELIRQADSAMYMAKGRGKGCFEVFRPRLTENLLGEAISPA